MILPLLAVLALGPAQDAPADPIRGHWSGALVRHGAVLPLAVRLGSADGSQAEGAPTPSWIDVPSWGLYDLPGVASYEPPALSLTFMGTHLRLQVDPQAGAMRGHLEIGVEPPHEDAISVELTRVLAPALPAIVVEEVRFESADGVELAGTLALPEGPGPHPAMVFVQGRTYGTRDQFRSHAILAARRGIAGLAFDGRGAGGSGGVRGQHTRANRLDDAQAALELVRSDPRVDPERVGLFGHSSGGWVVPVVAQRSPPVAFLVLHSGPAEPLGDQQGHVVQELVRRAGIEPTDEELAEILALYRALTSLAAAGAPWSEVEPVLAAARETRWAPHALIPDGADDVNFDYYGRNPHDATEALRTTKTPVLALFGSEDFVVRPDVNVPLLEELLRAAGNADHRIVVFEGADHDLMIPEVEGDTYRWQRRPPGYFELLFEWVGREVSKG